MPSDKTRSGLRLRAILEYAKPSTGKTTTAAEAAGEELGASGNLSAGELRSLRVAWPKLAAATSNGKNKVEISSCRLPRKRNASPLWISPQIHLIKEYRQVLTMVNIDLKIR